jgi:type IV secretion system T-DNA border endonuclease VirD2
MVRAARGYSPAIFKPIAKGGCHTGAQLKAQLTYLTTKSSHILDSRGTHDGKKTLTETEIDRVVRRFENQWGERHSPKLGHTSHLLMAFPVGTSGEEVRAITESICERFFQGEGSQCAYRSEPPQQGWRNVLSREGSPLQLRRLSGGDG